MVIDINGRQRGNEDLECQAFIHIRQDARIERMQTFNHQHGVFLQLQFASLEDTLTDSKIIRRQIHFLAVQEIMHLLAEERQIDRIDRLKIIFSVRVTRRVHTIDEIVVHGEHLRLDTIYQQLDLQTFGERSFTGRRRTGDKHDLRPFLRDSIRRLCNLLLVQSLSQLDHLKGFLILAGFVEIAHIIDTQQFVPAVILLEDREHLLLRNRIFEDKRVRTIRNTDKHSVFERLYVEERHITGTRQQYIRIIIDEIAHTEVTAVRVSKGLKDRTLVVETSREHLNDLLGLLLFLIDRTILGNDLTHTFLDSSHHLRRHNRRRSLAFQVLVFIDMPLERAVVTFADRMLHTQVHLWVQLIHRTSEHHIQSTHVHAHTTRRTGIQELHIFGFIEQKIEVLHFVVHVCCNDRIRQLDT